MKFKHTIAAKQLGRRAIGIEKEKQYCGTAVARLKGGLMGGAR